MKSVESEECLSALDTHMLHNGTSMLVTDYLYIDAIKPISTIKIKYPTNTLYRKFI